LLLIKRLAAMHLHYASSLCIFTAQLSTLTDEIVITTDKSTWF